MDLDLTCVESFVALAHDLHFGHSAAELHLSRSGLTKRLQKLEAQLGVLLVNRPPGGAVSLTLAGERFAPHANVLLVEAAKARDAARGDSFPDYRLGLPGQLRDHPELIFLPAIAAAVRQKAPGATVHCFGIPYPNVVSALLAGTVDVMWDISTAHHPAIDAIPLREFERIGILSAKHELATTSEVPVEQFAEQPMIFGRGVPQHWMARFYLDDVRPAANATLIAMDGRDSSDVKASLALDTGVTVAPAYVAQSLGPYLKSVKLTGVPLVPSFASRRKDDHRAAVTHLVDALQAVVWTGERIRQPSTS